MKRIIVALALVSLISGCSSMFHRNCGCSKSDKTVAASTDTKSCDAKKDSGKCSSCSKGSKCSKSK